MHSFVQAHSFASTQNGNRFGGHNSILWPHGLGLQDRHHMIPSRFVEVVLDQVYKLLIVVENRSYDLELILEVLTYLIKFLSNFLKD